MPERCTASIVDQQTEQRRRCNNEGEVAVTDVTGSREVYCHGHHKLYQEFLTQAEHDAARWRNVPQGATVEEES